MSQFSIGQRITRLPEYPWRSQSHYPRLNTDYVWLIKFMPLDDLVMVFGYCSVCDIEHECGVTPNRMKVWTPQMVYWALKEALET